MRFFLSILFLLFMPDISLAEPVDRSHLEKEWIVSFEENVDVTAILSGRATTPVSWQQALTGLGNVQMKPVFTTSSNANLSRIITIRAQNEIFNLQSSLEALPFVRYVQPNFLRSYCQSSAPDSLLDQQWALERIEAASAWEIQRGRRQIVLAIIDSGVEYDHPDLAANIWHNPAEIPDNGLDDDQNGYIDDVIGWDFTDAPDLPGAGDYLDRDNDPHDEGGHGTHVAGISAAVGNNGSGISGVAPNCRIMALRAGFRLQSGGGFLQDDDVAAAIVYAADQGANVINMSFGDPRVSPVLRDAIAYAQSRGCMLVAAAGNNGEPGLLYPAGYDAVIAVGATDSNDQRASTSSYGTGLDLMAPGVGILSTWLDGDYQLLGGTSMAAPHVTAAAGLLLSQDPTRSAEAVRAILRASADDLGQPGFDAEFGAGRLNIHAALTHDLSGEAVIVFPTANQTVTGQVAIMGRAHGSSFASYHLQYATGLDPTNWQTIIENDQMTIETDTLGVLNTSPLPDGSYTLRLDVNLTSGTTLTDQIPLDVDHTLPVVLDFGIAKRLVVDRWHYLARCETDDATRLELTLGADDGTSTVLSSPFVATHHVIDLTSELQSENITYNLSATVKNSGGGAVTYPGSGQTIALSDSVGPLDLTTISPYGFELLTTLPNGHFLPEYTDFDNDNQVEIAVMAYNVGAYGPITYFEWTDAAQFEAVFTTADGYLPWDVGDLDQDGQIDFLVGQARRNFVLEGSSSQPFPDRVIWQQDGVWGNTIADPNRDQVPDLISRHDPDGPGNESLWLGYATGNDAFTWDVALPNPTDGSNNIGSSMAIANFQGDDGHEILATDADGDVFMFSFNFQGDTPLPIWSTRLVDGQTPIVAAVGDLNQDGYDEFVVLTARSDPFDLENNFWTAQLYSQTETDDFSVVWQTELNGVIPNEANARAADFDGDGLDDLVLLASPDLYIFQNQGDFQFEPVFYTHQHDTNQLLIGDGDGNGRLELVLNRETHIDILEQAETLPNSHVPTGLAARAIDASQVELRWDPLPAGYATRIYRARDNNPLALYDAVEDTSYFLDSNVTTGQFYRYALRSVNPAGQASAFSAEVTVTPMAAPGVQQVVWHSNRQIAVHFTQPIVTVDAQPAQVNVVDGPMASSMIINQQGQRLIATFETPFQAQQTYSFRIADFQNEAGTIIQPNPTIIETAFDDIVPPALMSARIVADNQVQLLFSEAIQADVTLNMFDIEPTLPLLDATADSNIVVLTCSEDIAAGPDYLVRVTGVRDHFGNLITPGNGSMATFATLDLSNVYCYPNPVYGQTLNLANMPPTATIRIFTLFGDQVATIHKQSPQTEFSIPLENKDGSRLASGTYIYIIEAGSEVKRGKFAVVR